MSVLAIALSILLQQGAPEAGARPCYSPFGPVNPRLPLGGAACGAPVAQSGPTPQPGPTPMPIPMPTSSPRPAASAPPLPTWSPVSQNTVSQDEVPAAVGVYPAPVNVNGVDVYLLPPDIIVRPSQVNVAPPQVHFLRPGEAPPEGVAPQKPEPR